MKILLSSHGAGPYGAERVLLTLAVGLRDRGHDVVVEIPHEGPALDEAMRIEGVTVWHSRRPRLPRTVGEGVRYLLGALPATIRLWSGMRRGEFDVVWVNSLFNPIAALAARCAGLPIVWHLHERNLRGPAGVPTAWLVRLGSDITVAVSEFVAQTFAGVPGGGGRMEVLFAPFRRFAPLEARDPDGTFVVGYVGQFEPRKRVDDLVRAIAKVPGVRLLLVGDGKKRHVVEDLVVELGVGDRVEFAGFQSDVVAWYARMDCVVIPSRDEPCPLVAFESMAVGRPVIASRHGGHPEVLGEAALFFPLGDVDALAKQIDRLRNDTELRKSIREWGLRRVASLSLEEWWDRVENILTSVARRGRAR